MLWAHCSALHTFALFSRAIKFKNYSGRGFPASFWEASDILGGDLLVQIYKASVRASGICSFNTAEKRVGGKRGGGWEHPCHFLEIQQQLHVVFLWKEDQVLLLHCTSVSCLRTNTNFRHIKVTQKGHPEASSYKTSLGSAPQHSADCNWPWARSSTLFPSKACLQLPTFSTMSSGHSFIVMLSSSHADLLTPGLLEISLYSSSWLSSI